MKLYQLKITLSEDAGCGENWDEWFSSLRDAQRARMQYIRENPMLENLVYGESFSIWRVVLTGTPKEMVLAALNSGLRGEQVVPPYVRPARDGEKA